MHAATPADGLNQVALAQTAFPYEGYVVATSNEVAGAQLFELIPVDRLAIERKRAI